MRLLATLALLCFTASAAAQPETVRVKVFADRTVREARVSSSAPMSVITDGVLTESIPVGRDGVLQSDGGNRVRLTGSGLHLTGKAITVTAGHKPLTVRIGSDIRHYPGEVTIRNARRGLEIVNTAPLESYVASVVASEYPFQEIEGVKAQAVLVRGYALRHRGDHATYDVTDTQASQVYRGLSAVTSITEQAARETAGEVLTYHGTLAESVYSSSNGGHTADNESVWVGAPVPYLRGRPDPYDRASPHHAWTKRLSARRVHRALGRSVGGFSITSTSPEGRVTEVTLDTGRRLSGSDFRRALNASLGWATLRSTLFSVEKDGSDYVFSGGGFGHGVGMSQYGARRQAQAGRSYRDILAFYFEGTAIDLHGTSSGSPVLLAGDGQRTVRRMPTPRSDDQTRTRTRPTPRSASGARRVAW